MNQGLILGEMEYHFFEYPNNGGPISATEITGIDEEAQPNGPPKMFGFLKSTGEKIYATRVIEPLVEKKGDKTGDGQLGQAEFEDYALSGFIHQINPKFSPAPPAPPAPDPAPPAPQPAPGSY